MNRLTALVVALAATACAKQPAAPEVISLDEGLTRRMPTALPAPVFTMPPVASGTLSNGVTVHVVENHEVPTFTLSLSIRRPAGLDPRGKEGLTSLLVDLMDEASGGKDAVALGRAQKALGGRVSAGASADRIAFNVSGPVRTLDGLLDLWADVLLRPDLPEDEWEILQPRRVKDLVASFEDPRSVAGRVSSKVLYGDAYTGALATPTSMQSVTLRDLRAALPRTISPRDAVLHIGGDVTLDDILPRLEARLAGWVHRTKDAPRPADPAAILPAQGEVLYAVHMPGAAQSEIRAYLAAPDSASADWFPLFMGNTAFGGAFTARVNMRLREEKGWTYGARCGVDDTVGDALWYCSTSVQTDKTAPALAELRGMIDEVRGSKPVTADEIAFFRSYRVNSFYGSYETPSDLLGALVDQWVTGKPDSWLATWVPSVEAVDAAAANAALQTHLTPERLRWVVVGDLDAVGDALRGLGVPVVVLDKDGRPAPSKETP